MGHDRKAFLRGGAAALASIGFVRSPGDAAEITWKWAHATQTEHPLNLNVVRVGKEVLARSKGRMQIQSFGNSVLGGDPAMLQQARTGAIQIYSGYGGIYQSVAPLAGIEAIGFAFRDQKQALAAFDGPLGTLIRKQMDEKGPFVTFERPWVNGFRQVTTSTRPIRALADISGLKIRTPPSRIWVDMFKTLGASPTPIAAGEMYTALQTHVVDGQENPFTIIETFRLYEVQKYISVTNHMWSNFWVVANAEAFNGLPRDLQKIVRDAINDAALSNRREMELSNASLADKLVRRGMRLNQVDTRPFRASLKPFYETQRKEFGETAWSLLQQSVGELG